MCRRLCTARLLLIGYVHKSLLLIDKQSYQLNQLSIYTHFPLRIVVRLGGIGCKWSEAGRQTIVLGLDGANDSIYTLALASFDAQLSYIDHIKF